MAFTEAAIIATAIALPLVGAFTLSLRFGVRIRIHAGALGLDDWFVGAAFFFLLGMAANQIAGAVVGSQGHDHLTLADAEYHSRAYASSKITFVTELIEKLTFGLIKLSVLLFYRRIFNSTRSFNIANNILIVLVTAWTLTYFLGEVFACGSDPSLTWRDPKLCVRRGIKNHPEFLLWYGITDIVSDAAILVMPYPAIRKLRKTSHERIGIACIFALGWLSLGAGIARMVSVAIGTSIDKKALSQGLSQPFYSGPLFWTLVEASVGIVAANLPTLAPLLRKAPGLPSVRLRHGSTTSLSSHESVAYPVPKSESAPV